MTERKLTRDEFVSAVRDLERNDQLRHAPQRCAAPNCQETSRLVTFVGTAPTLRSFGFAVPDDGLVARLCLYHYLLAMNEILARAGLPRLTTASEVSRP
jgi:hypothetical protein